jgi:hypothetical protein
MLSVLSLFGVIYGSLDSSLVYVLLCSNVHEIYFLSFFGVRIAEDSFIGLLY